MNRKRRDVPNVNQIEKTIAVVVNRSGSPEQIVTRKGFPPKRVLNELDPSETEGDSMSSRLDEMMSNADIGDLTKIGGMTDQLGAKTKNSSFVQGDSKPGKAKDGVTSQLRSNELGHSTKDPGTKNSEAGKAKDDIQDVVNGMKADLGDDGHLTNSGSAYETVSGTHKMAEAIDPADIAVSMDDEQQDYQALFNEFAKMTEFVTLEDFNDHCQSLGMESVDVDQLRVLMQGNDDFVFVEEAGHIRNWSKNSPASIMMSEDLTPEYVGQTFMSPMPNMMRNSNPLGSTIGAPTDDMEDPMADPMNGSMENPMDGGCGCSCHSQEGPMQDPAAPQGPAGMDAGGGVSPDMGMSGDFDQDFPSDEGNMDEFAPMLASAGAGLAGSLAGKALSNAFDGDSEVEECAGMDECMDGTQQMQEMDPMTAAIGTGAATFAADRLMDDDDNMPYSESVCQRCGYILDALGCAHCELMRETHEMGMTANASTNDKGQYNLAKPSAPKSFKNQPSKAPTQESSNGEPKDGVTDQCRTGDLGNNSQMCNTGGSNEPLKGGSGTMKENVVRLANYIKPMLAEHTRRLRPAKYNLKFTVVAEGVKSRHYSTLTDALVDTEELMQLLGPDKVQFTASYWSDNKLVSKLGTSNGLNLPYLNQRKPLLAQEHVVFRYPELAHTFADVLSESGKVCRVKNHNWGAAVSGKFEWRDAVRAYRSMILS